MSCVTSLARSSSSWMSLAVGDSGSQTRCIMGIILWPGPKVQGRRALLCSGDQSKLFFLCEEDKARLRSKHPAPSFLPPPPFVCPVRPSSRTDKCTRRWTRRSIHPFENESEAETDQTRIPDCSCSCLTGGVGDKMWLREDGTIQIAFAGFSNKVRVCVCAQLE